MITRGPKNAEFVYKRSLEAKELVATTRVRCGEKLAVTQSFTADARVCLATKNNKLFGCPCFGVKINLTGGGFIEEDDTG